MERKIVVGYEEETNKEVVYDPDSWHTFLISGREGYGRLDLLKKLTLGLVCGSKAEFYLFGDVFFTFVYPDADCAKLHASSEKERIVAYLDGLVQTMEQRFTRLEEKGFATFGQANAKRRIPRRPSSRFTSSSTTSTITCSASPRMTGKPGRRSG
jgi:hypothetical protein